MRPLELNCNNFTFNDVHSLQIQGAAMGAFEDSFVRSYKPIPAVYHRCIDDIFLKGSEDEDSPRIVRN